VGGSGTDEGLLDGREDGSEYDAPAEPGTLTEDAVSKEREMVLLLLETRCRLLEYQDSKSVCIFWRFVSKRRWMCSISAFKSRKVCNHKQRMHPVRILQLLQSLALRT
jgi:hypothetical protein